MVGKNVYPYTPRPDFREPQSHTSCIRNSSVRKETLGWQGGPKKRHVDIKQIQPASHETRE
eukprot:425005-Pleurochrysis_carterae.AAC.1